MNTPTNETNGLTITEVAAQADHEDRHAAIAAVQAELNAKTSRAERLAAKGLKPPAPPTDDTEALPPRRFRRGELQGVIRRPDGTLEVHHATPDAKWVKTVDGLDYHVIPHAIGWLDQALLPGPVVFWMAGNPQAVWEQEPKGFTAAHLRRILGGTLAAAVDAGHADPYGGSGFLEFIRKYWYYVLTVIGAIGAIAFFVWKKKNGG